MNGREELRSIDTSAEVAVLVAQEERLRLAMRAAQVYFWDWDVVRDVIVWDEGLASSLQLGMDEVPTCSARLREVIHPADFDRVAAAIENALEGGCDYEVRFRMVRKDGSVRWADSRAVVVRDAFGRPVRMVGSDRDVTKQVELEQEATDARFRLARIAEAARLAWFEIEQADEGYRASASDHCGALLGLAQGDKLPADITSRIHPKDRPAYGTLRERLALWGGDFDDEFRIVLPSGVVRRVRSIGRAHGSPGGELRRMTGIFMDVTARQLADDRGSAEGSPPAALPTSSPTLAAAIAEAAWHLTRDAIELLDEEGVLIDHNEAAESRFGPMAKGQGRWAEAFEPVSRREADRSMSNAADGNFATFVAVRPVAGGAGRRFAIELSPLLDRGSRCIGVLARSRLLTEAQG